MRMVVFYLLLTGCVSEDTAVSYARRAHPECSGHDALSHRWAETSQTEVSMVCGPPDQPVRRSITVKCVHGFGIFADTTCHENN